MKCRWPVSDRLTEKRVLLDVRQMLQQSKEIGARRDSWCSNQRFRDVVNLAYDAHAQVVKETYENILL